jgi:UDP-2,3-diacylglucosamine hydrolase
MSRVFFFSDAHLGLESEEKEREKESRLLRFLDHVEGHATHLFIVGDLFDAWFEYATVIPKGYHRLLTRLEDLARKGIETHYLAGNHDYWMRDYFSKHLGIVIHSDPFTISIAGKSFYLHHGDGLATNDMGYRILKKILRNPISIRLYTWIHPDIGIRIARLSSRKSRHYTSHKDYGESDGMQRWAARRIREGADFVVMGHRHHPTSVVIGNGLYVNLGDWISFFTYAEYADGKLELKTWEHS